MPACACSARTNYLPGVIYEIRYTCCFVSGVCVRTTSSERIRSKYIRLSSSVYIYGWYFCVDRCRDALRKTPQSNDNTGIAITFLVLSRPILNSHPSCSAQLVVKTSASR